MPFCVLSNSAGFHNFAIPARCCKLTVASLCRNFLDSDLGISKYKGTICCSVRLVHSISTDMHQALAIVDITVWTIFYDFLFPTLLAISAAVIVYGSLHTLTLRHMISPLLENTVMPRAALET